MPVDRTRLPAIGSDPRFHLPEARRSTLANGTRLWAVEHRRAPVLSLLLLIPSGASVDPSHQLGLAALTADLLDEGSADHTAIELHEALSRIGGHLSIEVTSDATVVSLTTLARRTHEALRLLSEIVTRPRFDPDDVTRVRDLRLHRIRQMRQAPSAVADRAFLKALYGKHPYGHLAIGTDAALRATGPTDVSAFHSCWYSPARWTLVAVGDVPAEELHAAADELFAHGGREVETPPVVSLPDPPPVRDRLIFVSRQGAVQSEIRLGHLGASRSSPDYHALRVLNMVLGGQFVSRINLNLREAKGYTYGARTTFDLKVGRGPFVLQVSVQTPATADAIAEALREIADIRDRHPVTEEELVSARAALTRGFPRAFETASQIARAGLQLSLHDLPDDHYAQFVPRTMAVDTDEVSRVAARHLHPDQLLAVVVGSRPDVFDALADLGFGDPIELPSDASSQ